MLDSETRRRIDTARDILVGKVPDPKSQVEQITIALVYKFMDDMDKQSIEMGGKASFFKGEYKKNGWSEIFNPRLGGVEMLNLYGEAITRMSQNANLPQLFRDIFKNAFLPYRDPETLKLFLKTINEFTYDHSEKLGDAFEYLLSVLGSQGDAGQFRTPRHIIDFMVQVLAPKKNETVLDPACGTAGFLISAYKYMVQSAQEAGKPLSAQDKKQIYDNFTGYDISPDMVRLSLVNLYLHGFVKPNIHEYDTLTSEERWNEYADVILANPPFMSPKGGIQPHKRFSVQSNRSEVLFVDYMAEHLTPNGRAAIIVPEGIIFQSAGAYKQLRKYLIEHNFLWAVVSLPAGAFNPYSGVKTSILFLDKSLAKKTDKVLFVKVENDGFDLGAQRRTIDRNDLPQTLKVLKSFRASILDGKSASIVPEIDTALLVSISKLEESDYNLSANRYLEVVRIGKQTHPMVKLKDICEIIMGQSPDGESYNTEGNGVPLINGPVEFGPEPFSKTIKSKFTTQPTKYCKVGDLILCVRGSTTGRMNIAGFDACVGRGVAAIRSERYQDWVNHCINSLRDEIYKLGSGSTFPNITYESLSNIEIPLPPLETQRQLVDEITAHQRMIDGARQVVEGWKPDVEIELRESLPHGTEEWERTELGGVCSFVRGPFGGHLKKEIFVKEGYLVYEQYHAINNDFEFGRYFINEDKFQEMKRFEVLSGDVLVSCSGTMGRVAIVPPHNKQGIINQALLKLTPCADKIDTIYLKYLLEGDEIQNKYFRNQPGVAIQNVASVSTLKSMKIPLPPLEVQHEIVARLERERSIVEGNRELIRIYEEKVKKVIERVWES